MCENVISELIPDAAGVGDMTVMGTYERMRAYLWGHATCEGTTWRGCVILRRWRGRGGYYQHSQCCLAWPELLLASANDIPPNVCPHQPTINTMHGQSGQAWAQHWEPVYTHTMTLAPSWLRSLQSRINEILLRCWHQSESYWRKIMKTVPISEGPGCWWLRRQIVLVSCPGCQAVAGWNDSRAGTKSMTEDWASRSQAKYLINVAPVSPHQRQHPPFSTSEHRHTGGLFSYERSVDNSMQNIFSNECQL